MRISDWSSDVCSSDLTFQPCIAVQPDRRAIGALQSAVRSPPRRKRSPRRSEHRRHPCRPGRCARAAQSLGENQPFTAGRCDPPCPLRRRGKDAGPRRDLPVRPARSEEHTSELQSLLRISYAVFCLKKTKIHKTLTIVINIL